MLTICKLGKELLIWNAVWKQQSFNSMEPTISLVCIVSIYFERDLDCKFALKAQGTSL